MKMILPIVLLALMLVLSGCTTPNQSYVSSADQDFLEWTVTQTEKAQFYSECISDACDRYALSDLQYYGEAMEDWADSCLVSIYQFDVSVSFLPLWNEYKDFLEDSSNAGFYCYMGAKYQEADYIDSAVEYTNAARIHLEAFTVMVEGI